MRRIMKRLGAVAVILLLLSGCTQQAVQKEQEEQPRTMSMVIASDAPTSIQLAAQEFANRLAYYSDGELEVLLSASDQLDAVLTADDTQFAFVENERLSKTIEPLETFALPFFFQDADYLFSGLNSAGSSIVCWKRSIRWKFRCRWCTATRIWQRMQRLI